VKYARGLSVYCFAFLKIRVVASSLSWPNMRTTRGETGEFST